MNTRAFKGRRLLLERAFLITAMNPRRQGKLWCLMLTILITPMAQNSGQFNHFLSYPHKMSSSRQIEVNLDLPSPVAGFAAVALGDGRFMITSKSLNLTIHNPNLDNSSWAQNSVQVTFTILECWQIVDLLL